MTPFINVAVHNANVKADRDEARRQPGPTILRRKNVSSIHKL